MQNIQSAMRFGLPLGSSLILCALVETSISLYEAGMDVISLFVTHWEHEEVIQHIVNSPTVMALNIALFMQIFADVLFLWIGSILKGNRFLLVSWICITALSVVVLNFVWVHYVYMDEDSETAWMSAVYTVVLYSLFYFYIISIACQCVKHMSDDLEELQPIGMGFEKIWKFFSKNAASGAKLLLLTELILDSYFFLSRKLPPVVFDRMYTGHEDDTSAPIVLEEFVIRGIRILMNVAGIVIIWKGKQRWMQYWCIPYLITVFLSFAIFMYLAFGWVAEHPFFTYGYLFFFAINICFRIVIFTICFVYSQCRTEDAGDFAFVTEFS